MEILFRLFQRIGPYLMIEMVMPGGTLIALGLYLYRRHRDAVAGRIGVIN